jgi:predicted nucleotidyltransferase
LKETANDQPNRRTPRRDRSSLPPIPRAPPRSLRLRRQRLLNEATSDLDFVATFADTQKPGYAKRYLHFAEALEELFGRSVDLITDGSIRNPYFQEEVDATRQPVYRAHDASAAA